VRYRNIDIILKDYKLTDVLLVSCGSFPSRTMTPIKGDEVGLETLFEEFLRVEIHTVTDDGKMFQGAAKLNLYIDAESHTNIIIPKGDLLEFSYSKIYKIYKGNLP
jgi:hypothetical protein